MYIYNYIYIYILHVMSPSFPQHFVHWNLVPGRCSSCGPSGCIVRGQEGVAVKWLRFNYRARGLLQGLVTVPFWEYWTSPEKVAIKKNIYLMVRWCSMGTFNDPCSTGGWSLPLFADVEHHLKKKWKRICWKWYTSRMMFRTFYQPLFKGGTWAILPPKNGKRCFTIWVWLKIVYPYTQWLMIIIPIKWL